MINKLVFDTNVWLSFIERTEFDLLEIISAGIKNNLIEILLPEFVEFEFNKKIDNVISTTLKNERNINHEDLNSITDVVLNIFESSTKLKTNEIGINEWITKREAPNHNKNNYEDTVILNTLLTLEKGTVFYLITNDSDYRVSKDDYRIHPDIENKFTTAELKINFSTDLKKIIYHQQKIL